jgi:hypothetical protein
MKDALKKMVDFPHARFPTEVLEEAVNAFSKLCTKAVECRIMTVTEGREKWSYTDLREFFSAHRKSGGASFHLNLIGEDARTISIAGYTSGSEVSMEAKVKGEIQSVTSIFESA